MLTFPVPVLPVRNILAPAHVTAPVPLSTTVLFPVPFLTGSLATPTIVPVKSLSFISVSK